MSGHNYENNARRPVFWGRTSSPPTQKQPNRQVVLKMRIEPVRPRHHHGGSHGRSWHAGQAIARTNGHTALRIAFIPVGGHNLAFAPKPGNPTKIEKYESKESKEFFSAIKLNAAALPKEGWSLIPLEPIRQSLDNKGIDALKPFSRFLLLGYDYVVTTPDAKAAESLY